MISIDGSILEGGGQILRVALSLSCLLRKPIYLFNIRAGRPNPGLQAQHLKGLKLMQDISRATVEGDFIGSTKIKFSPQAIVGGNYFVDIKTAGSVALIIQVALPVLLFAEVVSVLNLKGGTNTAHAPQIDHTTEIFRPNLRNFNASFEFELFKRGYFPHGGGHCEIFLYPIRKLSPATIIEFGTVDHFFGWSFVSGTLPHRFAHEIKSGAIDTLKSMKSNAPINITAYKELPDVSRRNCAGLILTSRTSTRCIIGGSALCSSSAQVPYNVGVEVATEVISCIQKEACVDPYTQDQLIIYMALAEGLSRIKTTKPTLHTKTAIYVVELMSSAKFQIIDVNDDTCIIQSHGIGLQNNFIK